MWHALECARQTAHVVPAVPGGAAAHRRRSCPGPIRGGAHPQHRRARRAANPQLPRGYRWIAVRPGAGPPQRRRRRVLSPTPRYPGQSGLGPQRLHRLGTPGAVDDSGRAVGRTGQVGPESHRDRVGRRRRRARGALHPAGDQPEHAAASRRRRCGPLARRRRQRGGTGRGDRLRGRAHPVADRPSRRRLRALSARRSASARLRCGRAAWYRWSTSRGRRSLSSRPRPSRGSTADCARPITVWWVLWVLSTLLSIFAIATSFTTDAQGIADNTVTTMLAYLLALAVVLALTRVYEGFVRKPVDRPAHRWVVVGSEQAADPPPPESPARLSRKTRNRRHSAMGSPDEVHGGHPFVVAHRGASASPSRAHAGGVRAGPAGGRRRRRVRCPTDP